MSFLSGLFGSSNDRFVKSLQPIIDKINALEKDYGQFSDEELKQKTTEFKKRLSEEESLDDLLPEAFALVREASKRTLGQCHYDVQLMGGIVLHQGKIAEMKTGEGKTLVATLAVYLNALEGQGVHVVTVNDYLARRDTTWMGQIYYVLGLSTACINHEASYIYDPSFAKASEGTALDSEGTALDKERDITGGFHIVHEFLKPILRREAYKADITYGTNNEYGFDYLRDNMAYSAEQMVQRPEHHYAIVDEVDSILIDEARTPLIISAPDEDSGKLYGTFARIVPKLIENSDYNVDEKLKAVSITESGIEKVEQMLGIKNIYDEGGVRHVHHLEQALKANVLYKRDRDYVVKDGEIIIVDEFTGRLMPGRRWSEGLHQAVEAKEGVQIQKESRTMATITFQNYFRLYKKLAGMTGTAQTSAEEFHKVYKLDVVTVPTNRPMIRKDLPDRVYKTEKGKIKAIVEEVKRRHFGDQEGTGLNEGQPRHRGGQPVLIGTVSIEKNEILSRYLEAGGVPHSVLNAKNHEKEAEIIAQAGQSGAVTLATNIAGRGVDIILGGNPPISEEAGKVLGTGGLHVIGTERHEARRIDNQLRGRSGRQGDPGSSQFFISTEDELVRIFSGDRLRNIMERLGADEDFAIENRIVSNSIEQAQSRVEGHHFDARKYVLEYDDVMNKHRETIYGLRREVLFSNNVKDKIKEYLSEFVSRLVAFHTNNENGEENVKEIAESVQAVSGPNQELQNKLTEISKSGSAEELTKYLNKYFEEKYEAKEKEAGTDNMRQLEKMVMLRTIDEIWVDHIDAMEYLRDSVGLRAYGQRDPLAEYKVEAQKIFRQLLETIKMQVADLIFKVSLVHQPHTVRMEEGRSNFDGQVTPMEKQIVGEQPKIGRNKPCPCGSGLKYKKCHGA